MADHSSTRRDFLKVSSAAVAGAALTGSTAAAGDKPPARKILNHNPKMGYRRLGKTELWISEISLGGHGGKEVSDRVPVLERAVELGMNYVDNNIAEECTLYGKAIGRNRDKWHIGFASWPEKLTSEYEQELTKEGMFREIDARLKNYGTDMLDLWRPVGATWGEGQKDQKTMWEVTPRVLDMVVDVFETVKKQGKVRFLGISAHNPIVFRRVLNDYPQFSVILFPYMFLTQSFGGDSLLALAREKDVGVIGIKPFAAGATFVGGKPTPLEGRVDPRASSLLKGMLREQRISAVIPGVTHHAQLDENVKASYERDKPLTDKDRQAVRECTESFHAHLPEQYQWLHDWKTV
ncbi:MAG: hypothetical protein AMXMBFR13_34890 [Phycisphaerae bacterium]